MAGRGAAEATKGAPRGFGEGREECGGCAGAESPGAIHINTNRLF